MKTSIFHGHFKRHETRFNGSEDHAGRELLFSGDTVKIIGRATGTDPDDDVWHIGHAGKSYNVDGCDLSPHPEERELNTEFVERLMESGSPLMHGFVIQAIEQFAKAVLAAPEEIDNPGAFISNKAWRECARFTLGNFVARDAMNRRDAA